jgi:hypothetical protein
VATAAVGQPPDLSVDKPVLDFPEQRVGTPSGVQSVLVRNNARDDVRLEPARVTGTNRGDFGLTDTCGGTTLPALGLCRMDVVFTPGGMGGRSATLTIPGSDPARPFTVALSGTGTAPVLSLSPGRLDFPAQRVGTAGAQQPVTLANNGTAPATVSVTGPSGANSGDFLVDQRCARELPAASSCTFRVRFKPTAVGTRNAALTIVGDNPARPLTIPLSGTATAPSVEVSPGSLTFSGQDVETPSEPQSVTLTNRGTAPANISGTALSGANQGDFSREDTCAGTLAPGTSCTVEVTFTPTDYGTRLATLTITHDAPGSPTTVELTGQGGNLL